MAICGSRAKSWRVLPKIAQYLWWDMFEPQLVEVSCRTHCATRQHITQDERPALMFCIPPIKLRACFCIKAKVWIWFFIGRTCMSFWVNTKNLFVNHGIDPSASPQDGERVRTDFWSVRVGSETSSEWHTWESNSSKKHYCICIRIVTFERSLGFPRDDRGIVTGR